MHFFLSIFFWGGGGLCQPRVNDPPLACEDEGGGWGVAVVNLLRKVIRAQHELDFGQQKQFHSPLLHAIQTFL